MDESCGAAVLPDDPKTFAAKLIEICDDPELTMAMSIAGRQLAEQSFGREQLADKFADVIERTYSK